jgi:hypothetical protein
MVVDDLADLFAEVDKRDHLIVACIKAGAEFCPFCGGPLGVLARGWRRTFAGWEAPCVQYQCDPCGYGGEFSTEQVKDAGR